MNVQKDLQKWKKVINSSKFCTLLISILVSDNSLCGLSAKDRGVTENPVSDLELNLSKTARKAIESIL